MCSADALSSICLHIFLTKYFQVQRSTREIVSLPPFTFRWHFSDAQPILPGHVERTTTLHTK